jgi:uncharacterized damage-inducible protein DinB
MTKDEYYDFAMQAYQPALTMIGMAPADKLDWRPAPNFMSLGQLICHLSDGLGEGLRFLITGNWPTMEEMAEGMRLENLPACTVAEARAKLEKDQATLREVLAGLSAEDFAQKVVTVPWGVQGKLEKMALHFREHFTNHKQQLFTYLKLLGLPVDTTTLYGG